MGEWQTRSLEGRLPQGVQVRVLPWTLYDRKIVMSQTQWETDLVPMDLDQKGLLEWFRTLDVETKKKVAADYSRRYSHLKNEKKAVPQTPLTLKKIWSDPESRDQKIMAWINQNKDKVFNWNWDGKKWRVEEILGPDEQAESKAASKYDLVARQGVLIKLWQD